MLPQSMCAPSLQNGARLIARLLAALLVVFLLAPAPRLPAQEALRIRLKVEPAPQAAEFGKLFDAVVEQTAKSFWDKERLTEIGWRKRAAEVRQSVVDAPTLEEAARRINVLLGELN